MKNTFEQQQYNRRLRIMTTSGIVLLCFALGVAVGLWYQKNSGATVSAPYHYSVSQSISNAVLYHQNSFYGTDDVIDNTAFVAPLTNEIRTQFHYQYSGTKSAALEYRFGVAALIRGTYALSEKEEESANVWTKQYELIAPITKQINGTNFVIDQPITIPYEQYRILIDQYRSALQVPVDGEAIISIVVSVKGVIDGTPFDDTKTSTIALPLTRQIYQPATKYEKNSSKDITTASSRATQAGVSQLLLVTSVVFTALGVALIVFAMRRRIFRTSYQKELDKIYRYHEGIIVRAREHPDLSGKRIVAVKSFDDMLNLEEEVKAPIVSSEAGEHATRFMIIKDDVVYMYLLGSLSTTDDEVLREIQDAFDEKTEVAKKPLARTVHRKVQ